MEVIESTQQNLDSLFPKLVASSQQSIECIDSNFGQQNANCNHQHTTTTTNPSEESIKFGNFNNTASLLLYANSNLVQTMILQPVSNFFNWLSSFEDPRVDNWPLMSSSLPVFAIFFAYLFAANYGPVLMKNRKPFQLRSALIFYNLYIASLNLWIAVEPNNTCEHEIRIANAVWWYFASKGFEFADTLFFVLRKKDRQLTFLHKYHHSSMFLVWWTAVRFVPGGSAIVPIVINSLVHVLMYSYYGISAIGPSMSKYLWWKKYLTIVQLIQFFVGVSIGAHLITSGCMFTRWMQYVFSCYAFSFIILFGNFYLHEYSNSKDKRKNIIDESITRNLQIEDNLKKDQ